MESRARTSLTDLHAGAHIPAMPKSSNREKILSEGLRVVHERGFGAASVRDIVQAADVPQGSFTNHFASKEAFALEIIELYFAKTRELLRDTLHNESIPPLERLHAYLTANKRALEKTGMRNGCLFGNFSAESGDVGTAVRRRIIAIFKELQAAVSDCLKEAVEAGELSPNFDIHEISTFVISSLQGATLMAKVERSVAPLERFERVLFSRILR